MSRDGIVLDQDHISAVSRSEELGGGAEVCAGVHGGRLAGPGKVSCLGRL